MDKRKNGEGTIINRWEKYGNKNGKKYQCRILCSELDDNGKKHYVYANDNNKETARKKCREKADAFEKKQQSKLSPYYSEVAIKDTDTFDKSSKVFFNEYAIERKWTSYTRSTRAYELKAIINRIGTAQIKSIKKSVIDKLFLNLLDNYNRQTVGKMYGLMRAYFEWLIDKAIISDNPFLKAKSLPSKTRTTEATQEELKEGKWVDEAASKIFDEQEIE